MRERLGIIGAILALLLLLTGVSTASASETDNWDTTGFADFGFGVTEYRAETTVRTESRIGRNYERHIFYLTGVEYQKVDGPAGSPESFVITDGTFAYRWITDAERTTLILGIASWRFTIETSGGAEYDCKGLILGNSDNPRRVERNVGPVIEP